MTPIASQVAAPTAWILQYLWLIPVLPILAAGFSALLPKAQRRLSATLAIGSMSVSLILAIWALAHAIAQPAVQVVNFPWMQFGSQWVALGWLLDPLASVMLVMVSFVGLLIFIYSLGYMAHDDNFTRFFTFLALFAGAMLGVIIANSLLLLFMCWEVVGLTSYLLIGFWFHRPAAAAAAKKAFIVTRVGDLGLLLGMVWLYAQTGTLLFYNSGAGCLEHTAVVAMGAHLTAAGMAVSTGIGLLIFCGAVGKSGQVPLHVWLPDAMEGPTPVSALIHAATMVAAGVYLMARVYPLLDHTTLAVIAWVGAITAFFAACIAVAQNDIKRILAYSTVSQLGYMMLGLGVGGVAVGMFHLITHAFFKSLLFLGAGSVIHGCSEEQDIRNMGGLRRFMPITFVTYAAAMLALCGFPLFAGFWSKDAILEHAHTWGLSLGPYYLGAVGALLTAFYMTRQMYYVFFGPQRAPEATADPSDSPRPPEQCAILHPHESPSVMTVPLVLLAVFAVFLGFVGTPAWPWFQSFLSAQPLAFNVHAFMEPGLIPLMLYSSLLVFAGLLLGWWFYGRKAIVRATDPDALGRRIPLVFHALAHRLYVDEFYGVTVIALTRFASAFSAFLDRFIFGGVVNLVSWLVTGLGWFDSGIDRFVVNGGFDLGCREVNFGGRLIASLQNGRVQNYLRVIAGALVVFAALLLSGASRMIITELTFLPLFGAFLVLLLGRSRAAARALALLVALASLGIALWIWHGFNPAVPGFQYEVLRNWAPSLGMAYHVGVDGLGVLMLVLSAMVVLMSLAASWSNEKQGSLYFALVLFLESGLFGTFTALNFVHWFIFWELSLIPAFFLVRLWGGPNRNRASTQFFLYTMVGSIALLLAFLALYLAAGTFDFVDLARLAQHGDIAREVAQNLHWGVSGDTAGMILFWAAFLGFAVKTPVVPFHTWLPATYAEAPSETTMLLTGAMSKMGIYGFLRILLPIFPQEMQRALTPLLWLAVATIVLPAFAAWVQKDLKRTFAYSSVNHLGYCILGVCVAAKFTGADASLAAEKSAALTGVMLQIFSHALTAAALFWFLTLLERRAGSRGIDDFGGLRKVVPVFSGLMGIAIFASLGLPGLNGFPGEFLIFKGSFPLVPWATAISVLGLLMTAVFLLTVIQKVFSGPVNPRWQALPDLTLAERWAFVPVIALMFAIGLYPQIITGMIHGTVMQWIAGVGL